jgi:hypothetical protein
VAKGLTCSQRLKKTKGATPLVAAAAIQPDTMVQVLRHIGCKRPTFCYTGRFGGAAATPHTCVHRHKKPKEMTDERLGLAGGNHRDNS